MASPQSREGMPADRDTGRRGGKYDGIRDGRNMRDRSRDGRDDKGRRERGSSRERGSHRGGRDNDRSRRHETRSRSPVRNDRSTRDNARTRSPPRGPRPGRGSPPRGPRVGGDTSSGRSQPGSRAPTGLKNTDKGDFKSGPKVNGNAHPTEIMDVDEDSDEEAQMMRVMGFADFKTTKNTQVPGNNKNFGVRKEKKIEYRQYMNRVGGFNRPLSPSR